MEKHFNKNIIRNYGEIAGLLLEIVCRLGLWILFACIEQQEPFIRVIDEEELWMYRYPVVKSYVRAQYLWHFIIVVPALVFILEFIVHYQDSNKVEDIKNDIAACTLAYPINGVLTSTFKMIVGRPRPNFFFQCFPDGFGTSLLNCTGDYDAYMDARRSFPSGHASFAFTSMVYLMFNLFRMLNLKNTHSAKSLKLITCILPPFLAAMIAISRTCDYHHHYSDAIGGSLLGSAVASVVYWVYRNGNNEIEI